MNPAQVKTESSESLDDLYFEFQADIGMTKHIGGTKATDALLKLCHVDQYSTVLDVGCGVGLTSCYIAQNHKVRVVGIDLRPSMIERANQYAKQAQLRDFVRFEVADTQDLPMSDDVYDAVICESVLAFVPDQKQAIKEWIRVTKPGGYIGFTEAIWYTSPPDEAKAQMDAYTGAGSGVQPPEQWEILLQQSGLENLVCQHYPASVLEDARRQIQRIGLPRLLKAWGKAIQLMFTNAEYRHFMGSASKLPKSLMKHMGYGIYVGQVPK
jgi:SAM-dependent methyltransferase